jgi:hypothetical protein
MRKVRKKVGEMFVNGKICVIFVVKNIVWIHKILTNKKLMSYETINDYRIDYDGIHDDGSTG